MIYCYACKCGNKIEKVLPLRKFREHIKCPACSGQMNIDIAAQQKDIKSTGVGWPMVSDALGVHPAQAQEFGQFLREQGVPTEVLPNGNPVLVSREHRKKVCAATGMYDRNAGYGDQAPQHVRPKTKQRRCYAR